MSQPIFFIRSALVAPFMILFVVVGAFFQAPEKCMADTFAYPELQVVPRASKQLAEEAKVESNRAWQYQAPLLVAAFSQVVAGYAVMSEKRPELVSDPSIRDKNLTQEALDAQNNKNRAVGMGSLGLGSAWLGVGLYLASAYRPYGDAWSQVRLLKAGDSRSDLERERRAEEGLQAPAKLGSKIKWIAGISMLATSLAMTKASQKTEHQIAAGLAGVAATLPLLFESHWLQVHDQHLLYKKKIYGPIASVWPEWNLQTQRWSSNAAVQWVF